MKKIYKYGVAPATYIDNGEPWTVEMPKGAEILHAGVSVVEHRQKVCIWALGDTKAEKEVRTFVIYGTGYEFLHQPKLVTHIGTFQNFVPPADVLVFHLFEEK